MNKTLTVVVIAAVLFLACFPFEAVKASTYDYTFFGAVYDNSFETSMTDSLTVTLKDAAGYVWTQTVSYGLNTWEYSGNSPLTSVSWNASSALNVTRSIALTADDVGKYFYLFIPSPDSATAYYFFTLTDYTGTVQYLQASLVSPTGSHIVERKDVGISGTVSFLLTQYLTYTLSAIGSAGSLSQTFQAENVLSANIPILAGSFPSATYGLNGTSVSARRYNETAISISYADDLAATTWLDVTITHKNGFTTVTDFYDYSTSIPYGLLFANADADKGYSVELNANVSGTVQSWLYAIPLASTSINPFEDGLNALSSAIPTLPHSAVIPEGFAVGQLPAVIIVALVLAIFSYESHEIGCLLSWAIAAVMVYLHWFNVSIAAFGFALFLSILIAIQEGKKMEREL
jgi:hypothetical protein